MSIYHQDIQIHTVSGRPSYHDIRSEVLDAVGQSQVRDGILVVQTVHTTCSFYYEETMHDENYFGDEYLQVDINEMLDKIAPRMTTENQYHSPGPRHIEFGLSMTDPNYPAEKWTMLNTDAHLRASVYGSNSMTLIIRDGELQLGKLGRIYFVDWDQLRERNRTVSILVLGDKK